MLLTLTMSFSWELVWLEYRANQEFISRNLCINKFKPRLQCNGKCQVVKKMAEMEKENSSAPAPKLKISLDPPAVLYTTIFPRPVVNKNKKEYNIFTDQPGYTSPVFPIFHPPA